MSSHRNAVTDSSGVSEISREEIQRRLNDASLTVVDVLPESSYAAAHIPGAINLPLEAIGGRARELLPEFDAEIAVYCAQFT